MARKFDIEEIKRLIVEEGWSMSQVAKHLTTAVATISQICKRNNIKSQAKHMDNARKKELPIKQIYDAYVLQASIHALAKTHRVPPQTLKRQLKAYCPTIVFRDHDSAVRPKALNDRDRLSELLLTKTPKEIALDLGVRITGVIGAMKRLGLEGQ